MLYTYNEYVICQCLNIKKNKRRRLGHRHTEREDTGRRRASLSQGERPREKPTLLTSSLHNWDKSTSVF